MTALRFATIDEPDLNTIDVHRRHGGYQALPKALKMTRGEVQAVSSTVGSNPTPSVSAQEGPARTERHHRFRVLDVG